MANLLLIVILRVPLDLLEQGLLQGYKRLIVTCLMSSVLRMSKEKLNVALSLRPRSHYSVFVSIRFCCIEATVHTTPFSYKNGEKNLRFCAFTLICPITQKRSEKHCEAAYWSVFKNLRFCAFTLIKCVFKNVRFCGYPLLTAFSKTSVSVAFCADQCEHLHKNGNGGFSLRFCTKTE